MKKLIILGLISLLFLSGCPDIFPPTKTPEERALEIAEETYEGRFVVMLGEALDNVQYCTVDELISEMESAYREQGTELPSITAEERQMLGEQLDNFKRCELSIERNVQKADEETYEVSYSTAVSPTCPITFYEGEQGFVVISVNIKDETATVTEGEITPEQRVYNDQMIAMLEEGGNCSFFLISFSTGTITETPV